MTTLEILLREADFVRKHLVVTANPNGKIGENIRIPDLYREAFAQFLEYRASLHSGQSS